MAAELVRKAEFGRMLGVGGSRITQYLATGMPVEPNGRIRVSAAMAWVEAQGFKPRPARATPEQIDNRRRIEANKADLLDLELAERRKSLADRRKVEDAVFRFMRAERDGWLAWVSRAAPSLAGALGVDQTVLFRHLDEAVRAQLAELGKGPGEPLRDV